MKVKSKYTLYFDYCSGEVDTQSPKNTDSDLKYPQDYGYVRAKSIFDVYDSLPYQDSDIKETNYENEVVAVNKNGFYVIYETLYDLQHSGWFEVIK